MRFASDWGPLHRKPAKNDFLSIRSKIPFSLMKRFDISALMTDELRAFLQGAHPDPFRILGPHRLRDDVLVRVFRPDAREISIKLNNNGSVVPAEKIQGEGLFQATLEKCPRDVPYTLKIKRWDGSEQITRDPYSYGVIMGEVDIHLFAEGQHWRLYDKFGAHLRNIGDDRGVYFAVWAPNAQRVSVVGDFNGWDGRVHAMRKLIGSGIWELFIPGIGENAHYKFEIRTASGAIFLKGDPFAFFSQHGKETASLAAGAEHAVIKGAGHCCNIEEPAAFDAAVIPFLARHGLWRGPV